jgi:NADH-ubiquinone oxidoreductase chain 5
VFYSQNNSFKNIVKHSHESPLAMTIPLFILSFGSIFSGYLMKDLFIGLGSDFFIDSIFVLSSNLIIIDSEFIPFYIKLIPTILSLFGMFSGVFFIAYFEYFFVKFRFFSLSNKVYNFLIHKWYFDFIYNDLIAKNFLIVSYNICFKLLDKGFVELIGPKGISYIIYKFSINIRKQQTGFIYQYICLMNLGIFLFFFISYIY